MKATIVVLVLGALLLHHHDTSVDAFQQSSSRSLNTLARTFSKSTPMHGYLDSLGNTATAFKDEASSTYLPPRYEAEYPRRHDFSKGAVYPPKSEPVTSTGQQSDPVSHQSSSKVYIGIGTGTGTSSASIYQYGQRTSPSELVGNAYMNMMGASKLATSVPSEENKPEPSIKKEVPVAKHTTIVKEAAVSVETKIVEAPELTANAAQPEIIKPAETPSIEKKSEAAANVSWEKPMTTSAFAEYLESLSRERSTTIVEDPKLATNVAPPEIIKPAVTPSIEKKAEAAADVSWEKPTTVSVQFTGYLDSLTKRRSTTIVEAPRLATNVVPSEIIKPAETPSIEKKAEAAADVSSEKPTTMSVPFTGYLDSLAKRRSTTIVEAPKLATNVAPSEIIKPAVTPSKEKEAETVADVSSEKPTTMSVPFTGYLDSLAKRRSTLDVSVSSAKSEPERSPTAFGGYIGSLTKASSEAVVPVAAKATTKTVQAPPEISSDTAASRLDNVKLQSDESSAEPKAVSSFGGYLGSLTKSSDKASGLESPVSRKGGVSEKPTAIPVTGYLGSLKQKISENDVPGAPVVAPSQTKKDNVGVPKATPTSHSGYLDSLMTQTSPEDELPGEPVVAPSSHTKKGDGATAHESFFAFEKTESTEEKFAAKIDFAPETPTPISPLDGGVPAQSEFVEDNDLPSWVREFMIAEDAASIENASFVEKAGFRRPLAKEKPNTTKTGGVNVSKDIWETATPMILQGGALRTWSEPTGAVERVQVSLKTEGRALNANVELWHGANNTPLKITIYSDDGGLLPFNAVIETPVGPNTIAIRNTGTVEFPLAACVGTDVEDVAKRLSDMGTLKTMQGGAIHSYPFDRSVASVQVLLMTNGRPLSARIELLQGPNNDKQVIDISTEDGMVCPFFAVIETPGTGNVVRVVNTASVEFPMRACVQPYLVEPGSDEYARRGWDHGGTSSFRPERRNDAKYESRKGIFE
jgi:hypothetical protein